MKNEARLLDVDLFVRTITEKRCRPCKQQNGYNGKWCVHCIYFDIVADALDLSFREEPKERGVWYPENSRNKSYKFICSACYKIAYCPPKIVHKKGIGDVKCCSLKYCPHCGKEMILRETIDE